LTLFTIEPYHHHVPAAGPIKAEHSVIILQN